MGTPSRYVECAEIALSGRPRCRKRDGGKNLDVRAIARGKSAREVSCLLSQSAWHGPCADPTRTAQLMSFRRLKTRVFTGSFRTRGVGRLDDSRANLPAAGRPMGQRGISNNARALFVRGLVVDAV